MRYGCDVMPKPDQLPPLTWIRAFCEAARHLSFKSAAETLGVSPSTVSHEIRKLEDWVQVPLFDRTGRSVVLTDEGVQLFSRVGTVFDDLETAFDAFAEKPATALRIGMFPFLASEFVMPRMPAIDQLLGGRTIEVISSNHLSDLSHPDPAQRLDAVIRYGSTASQGHHCMELTRVWAIPVVSGKTNISEVGEMRRLRLDSGFDGWQLLEDNKVDLPPNLEPPITVDNYVSGLRAVEQGLGIGIGLLPLVTSWIEDGRLRLWTDKRIEIEERYWLVCPKSSPHVALLDKLSLWLREEFSEQNLPNLTSK